MKILFVCTGNTCRSPMAEGLFNSACQKKGLSHRALSCGVSALSGGGPSEYAVLAAAELCSDIKNHFSRHISKKICDEADRIYCMSDMHAKSVLSVCPDAKSKIHVIDPPVPDPYGGGLEDYRDCAKALRAAVDKILADIGG